MTLSHLARTVRGLAAAAVFFSLSCSSAPVTSGPPSASPAEPSESATAVPTPRTTPPGTPAPPPSEPTAQSASIEEPPAPAEATPTPAPQPGLWRIQGYVVDDAGTPLAGVCVVIGPKGCQRYSPHTDERGHYFIDVAEGSTTFDFYFEMPGHQTVWWHVTPEGPIEFNVVLQRS